MLENNNSPTGRTGQQQHIIIEACGKFAPLATFRRRSALKAERCGLARSLQLAFANSHCEFESVSKSMKVKWMKYYYNNVFHLIRNLKPTFTWKKSCSIHLGISFLFRIAPPPVHVVQCSARVWYAPQAVPPTCPGQGSEVNLCKALNYDTFTKVLGWYNLPSYKWCGVFNKLKKRCISNARKQDILTFNLDSFVSSWLVKGNNFNNNPPPLALAMVHLKQALYQDLQHASRKSIWEWHFEAAVLAVVQLQVGPLVRQRVLVLAAPVQLLLLPPDSHCDGHVLNPDFITPNTIAVSEHDCTCS